MKRKERCILGIISGMAYGLTYGVVSRWINNILLPGIPLVEPPPGRFATILIEVLGGGALGFLVIWPEEFFVGELNSAITGALFSSLMSLRTETGNTERIIGASFVLFITFLPRIFFFLPAVSLVRWVVNVWEKETLYASYPLHRRIRSVLLLVFVGLASAILLEALVSFLRLGVQPPTAPWGNMLTSAQSFIQRGAWWMWLFPSLFIIITILCIHLMGDDLRDAIDPRSNRNL